MVFSGVNQPSLTEDFCITVTYFAADTDPYFQRLIYIPNKNSMANINSLIVVIPAFMDT
jgi:hypothetical protein